MGYLKFNLKNTKQGYWVKKDGILYQNTVGYEAYKKLFMHARLFRNLEKYIYVDQKKEG